LALATPQAEIKKRDAYDALLDILYISIKYKV
jgi:hypothetical protein